jgi:Fe(3+) dicitrate transport protein
MIAGMWDCVALNVTVQSQDSISANQLKDSTTVEYDSRDIEVIGRKDKSFDKLNEVDGFGIYSGRKSEVISPQELSFNSATNNSRQLYAKVAGLNIWENDPGGLQLGIGGRGLSPSRVSNFNTRQNGYDISADALGYPESYYIPNVQMIERIAIVRGAAALQYGTQFGGFVGYSTSKPSKEKLQIKTEQSVGSFGLFNSFLNVNGTIGDFDYVAMLQYKEGDGWRENSQFHSRNLFFSLGYNFSERSRLQFDYSVLDYLAKQPGGLTDLQFDNDPQQSVRNRNWFSVDWHILALNADIELGESTTLNNRTFSLFAKREALGFLGIIGRVEPEGNLDLLRGEFNNIGNETRIIHHYTLFDELSTLLVGSRLYFGNTKQRQGEGSIGIGADFRYENESLPSENDFLFPSTNIALFAENVFRLSEKLSITPGFRAEYINTESEGYYFSRAFDLADNLLFEEQVYDSKKLERSFMLFGLGLSCYLDQNLELYGNISQNYRAVNFNDLRVVNPNFRIDPDLQDESGYSIDLGFRGNIGSSFDFDISLFNINYNDKIGFDLRQDTMLFNLYRFRTNIADARTFGLESFLEYDMANILGTSLLKLPYFINFSFINSQYIAESRSEFDGNMLENAPMIIFRTGLSVQYFKLSASLQYSYTSEQFTDATNARYSPYAVSGLILPYDIFDISLRYDFDDWFLTGGITNVFNNIYFTRRATGYPGPGIIPAEPRSFYMSAGFTYQ